MSPGQPFRGAIVVAAAMVSGISGASAQSWLPGVHVGAGQGGFTGSQEFTWTHTVPNVSAFLSRPASWGLWLQPEAGYTRKVGVSTTPISRLTLSADYLEFPLLLQYRLRDAARVSPFIHAGPSISVRLRCTLQFEGSGVQTVDDCDVVRGEASQRVDATLQAGIGLAWMTAGTRMSLEGRAGAGLVSSAAPVEATHPRSFGWSVLLGASRPLARGGMPPSTSPPVRSRPVVPGVPGSIGLPPLAAATIVTPDSTGDATPVMPRPSTDPLSTIGPTRRVSVHAVDADVRTLLVAVAREAGLDLVVSGDVRARVSVALDDVPATEALRAIIQSAGLAISGPEAPGATAAIAFYQLPVNVNTASAATIAARFDVSAELAKFIVESREPRAP